MLGAAPYTAIIADSHPIIRLAIRALMTRHGHIVVAETDSSIETFELALIHAPDIIILDLNTPYQAGLSALSLLQSLPVRAPILMFSEQGHDDYAVHCSRLGAAGFVSKQAELRELLSAINAILRGYSYFPGQLLKRL